MMNGKDGVDTLDDDDLDFLDAVDDDFTTDEFVDGQSAIEADNDCGDSCKI